MRPSQYLGKVGPYAVMANIGKRKRIQGNILAVILFGECVVGCPDVSL